MYINKLIRRTKQLQPCEIPQGIEMLDEYVLWIPCMEATHSYYYVCVCMYSLHIHIHTHIHTYLIPHTSSSRHVLLSILLLTDGHAWPASVHTAPHHDCLLWAITMIYGLIPSALSFSPFLFIDIQLFSLITP